jgi:hypothetical protein
MENKVWGSMGEKGWQILSYTGTVNTEKEKVRSSTEKKGQ